MDKINMTLIYDHRRRFFRSECDNHLVLVKIKRPRLKSQGKISSPRGYGAHSIRYKNSAPYSPLAARLYPTLSSLPSHFYFSLFTSSFYFLLFPPYSLFLFSCNGRKTFLF